MGNKPDKRRKRKEEGENNQVGKLPRTPAPAPKVTPKKKATPKSNNKSGQTNTSKKEKKENPTKKRKKTDPKTDVKVENGKTEKKSTKEVTKTTKGHKQEEATQKRDKKAHVKMTKPAEAKSAKEKSEKTPKSKQVKSKVTTWPKAPAADLAPCTTKPTSKTKPLKDNKNCTSLLTYPKSVISSNTIQSKKDDTFLWAPKSKVDSALEKSALPVKKNTEQCKRPPVPERSEREKEVTPKEESRKKKKKKKKKKVLKSTKEAKDTVRTSKSDDEDQKPDQPFMIAEVSRPPAYPGKGSSVNSKGADGPVGEKESASQPKRDEELSNLDFKMQFESLGKSNEEPKSNPGQDNDEAFADERLNPIFKEEFEHLYDKLKTLNRAVLTLKESYRDHILSLVKLSKQPKTTAVASNESVDVKTSLPTTNMLTYLSDLKMSIGNEGKERKSKKDTDINTRYRLLEANKSDLSQDCPVIVDSRFDMAHFLDPVTRDNTFRDLFNEVATLNESLSRLKEFYESDGDFMIQEYENSDYRISRSTFDSMRQKTQMLLTICTKVTRIYNQDLLDMFRIT